MLRKHVIPLIIGFVIVLSFSCSAIYASPGPGIKGMALNFLKDVAGIDVENYLVASFNASTSRMPDSPHYQTDIKIVIANNDTWFEALITLVDGKIWAYHLDGEFTESNLTLWDRLAIADKILRSYQRFVGASYYGKLIDMLSAAVKARNLTVEDEEFALNISYTPLDYRENIVVRYTRKINGYKLPGDYFVLSISKDGLLTRLFDGTVYYVVTTGVKVSREQAINMALPYAEAYARQHGQKITAVNATFEFARDIGGFRGDNSAIYPQWSVWFKFDKVNEECVYGYAVMIWADTGEVYHHGPEGFYCSSSRGSTSANTLWYLVAATVATLTLFPALTAYAKYKAGTQRSNNIHIKDFLHIAYDRVSSPSLLPESSAKSSIALDSTNNVPTDEINADMASWKEDGDTLKLRVLERVKSSSSIC